MALAAIMALAITIAPVAEGFDVGALTPADQRPDLKIGQNCSASSITGEIVVCGRRRGSDYYRVPPTASSDPNARQRGEVVSTATALNGSSPCGIFAGERKCSKHEAAQAGLGGGNDPVTFAIKAVGALLNPDE